MKCTHTIDGVVDYRFRSTPAKELDFLATYYTSWCRESPKEVTPNRIVVEEVGRNTGTIFGFAFEGSPEEILPLARFLYLYLALGAACFCAPSPDRRGRMIPAAEEALRSFPEEARTPLPVVCSCVKEKKFEELAERLSASIPISATAITLEPRSLATYEWSVVAGFRAWIALMLTYGIQAKEEIMAGLEAVTNNWLSKGDGWKKDLVSAIELAHEGICSFKEALALAFES